MLASTVHRKTVDVSGSIILTFYVSGSLVMLHSIFFSKFFYLYADTSLCKRWNLILPPLPHTLFPLESELDLVTRFLKNRARKEKIVNFTVENHLNQMMKININNDVMWITCTPDVM